MKKILSGTLLLFLTQSGNLLAQQGWKQDINFQYAQHNRNTYTGTIDEDDNSYLYEYDQIATGFKIQISKYDANGVNVYTQTIGQSPYCAMPIGHYGGALETAGNFVYYATATNFINANTNIGSTSIWAFDKNNPSQQGTSFQFASIFGQTEVTDMVIKGQYLYICGYFNYNSTHDPEFLDPISGNSTFVPKSIGTQAFGSSSYIAKYELSTGDLIWAKNATRTGFMEVTTMQVDDQGRVYLAGGLRNGATLGNNINPPFTLPVNTTADYTAFVARYDQNGTYDPSFTPITITTGPVTSTMHADFIDDIIMDRTTNHLYVTQKSKVRKYTTNTTINSPTPTQIWETIIPQMHFSTLALSYCDEMYITGVKPNNFNARQDYFAQSLNKNTGALTTTLVSTIPTGTTYGALDGVSDGEIILVQSDGDKVIAGDFGVNSTIGFEMAIDYNSMNPHPSGIITYSNMTTNKGSFIGVYDDGLRGELKNDFKITNTQGVEKSVFNCGETILFDGTACENETNHFMDLWRRPIGSTNPFQYYGGFGWLGGQANAKNLSQMAANAGLSFSPNYEYSVKLAVQNNCVGWLAQEKTFTIIASTLNASFTYSLGPIVYNPTYGYNVFSVTGNSVANIPGVQHLWWVYNISTNTIVAMSPWVSNSNSYTFSNIKVGPTYRLIHVVKDPSGCAVQQNAYQTIGFAKSNTEEESNELTSEMLELQDQIMGGSYDYLLSTSENELTNEALDFRIFPNPAENSTEIVNFCEMNGRINLLNMDGKQIDSFDIQVLESKKIDLSDLTNGVYLIQIVYTNNVIITKRLIKQ